MRAFNSDAKYSDKTEVYTELLKTLNNILDETSMLAKSRKTRGENKDEE